MSCLFTFLRMSFETQKFNFDDVQFVYFFLLLLVYPRPVTFATAFKPIYSKFWIFGLVSRWLYRGQGALVQVFFLPSNPVLPLSSTRSSLFHTLARYYIEAEDSNPPGSLPFSSFSHVQSIPCAAARRTSLQSHLSPE